MSKQYQKRPSVPETASKETRDEADSPAMVQLRQELAGLPPDEQRERLQPPITGLPATPGSRAIEASEAVQFETDGSRTNLPPGEVEEGEALPTELKNRRFVGDEILDKVIAGTQTVTVGANGSHVRKIQAALEDLGHPLPKYHADGSFGSEAKSAVTAFQDAEKVKTNESGVVDQPTMQRLDRRAPQASEEVHAWREAEKETGGSKGHGALTNPRFTGDPVLEMLMTGVGSLTTGQKGPHIWKIQAALRDLGFKIKPDGDYGGITKRNVQAFQEAYNVKLTPGGGKSTYTKEAEEKGAVNGATMAALDAYAPANLPEDMVPQKLISKKGPDYAKLFADGKLEMTLAIGYDDNSKYHITKKRQAINYLKGEMGFTMTDPRKATAEQVKAAGLSPGSLDRELIYFTKSFHSVTIDKDVQVIVKLLCAKNDGSDGEGRLERFKKALEQDDVVLYTGHARAGTGPDFDPHESSKGNYVMGLGYSDKYNQEIAGAENQIDKTKMTDKYQIYQLWGCTTENYKKHLDKGLRAKGTDVQVSKDLVLTNTPIPTVHGLYGTLSFLQGLLAEASSATLESMTNAATRKGKDVTNIHGM